MNRYPLTLALAVLIVPGAGAQTKTPAKPAQKAASVPSAQNPFTPFKQFSAIVAGGPLRRPETDVSRSGSVLRTGSSDYYNLTDLDRSMTWTMSPGHCVKFPAFTVDAFPFLPFKKFNIVRSATHDPETIDDHPCKVETLSFQPKDGGVGFEMKVWQADDLKGFPIRIDWHNLGTDRTSTYKFTKVSLDPPDPKLFERPANCKGSGGVLGTTAKPGSSKPAAKPAPPTDKPAPASDKPAPPPPQ